MSFSSNAKAELCRQPISRKCCAVAESFGILLYCNTFSKDLVKIVTESRDFSTRLPKLFKRAFAISFDQQPEGLEQPGKRQFVIEDREKIGRIFEAFGFEKDGGPTLHVNYGVLESECCAISFLRGAFLAGGSVTDPGKRYHLEISTTHQKVSKETYALMLDLDLSPKDMARSGNSVLYFKQSDSIEDFLTIIGAPVCAMGVMEAKVEKELVNSVNRRVNCETANLSKVVDAAQDQLCAIRLLEKRGRLRNLPPKLLEAALLRKENPEGTLTELAEAAQPPITKPAMNHRMRKLIALSKE